VKVGRSASLIATPARGGTRPHKDASLPLARQHLFVESRRVNPNSPRPFGMPHRHPPFRPFVIKTEPLFRNTTFVVRWHLSPADHIRLLGTKKCRIGRQYQKNDTSEPGRLYKIILAREHGSCRSRKVRRTTIGLAAPPAMRTDSRLARQRMPDSGDRVASTIRALCVNIQRRRGSLHDLLRDHHFLDALKTWQFEHGIEQDDLHD
jgi:hypothetical protein